MDYLDQMELDRISYRHESSGCGYPVPQRTLPSCKYCGKGGLFWGTVGQNWRLMEKGKPHVCKEYTGR